MRIVLLCALTALPALAYADDAVSPPPDDLQQAADATAAVASVPQTKPAATDVDLSALGLDPRSSNESDDKLSLYGFADLTYYAYHFRPAKAFVPDSRGFSSGSLNLYATKHLAERWRFLSEVRFLYLPNGGTNPDGSTTTTSVGDPANFLRPISWGGISIERAYVDYDLCDRLTIRSGRFLTPYGIWNTDHGSPAIIAAFRPYVIGEQFFPEHQTGIELYGSTRVGAYKLGYHATATNGRNPIESTTDPDGQLAFGGRLELEAETLRVGVSGYGGRVSSVPTTLGATAASYDERSYGADAQWDRGRLHLQGEVIGNQQHYRDGERAKAGNGFAPDGRQWGAYALAGYRFTRMWNVMPYAFFEHVRKIDASIAQTSNAYNVGLNFRPTPAVVLKLHYTLGQMREAGLLAGVDADIFITQLAVVF